MNSKTIIKSIITFALLIVSVAISIAQPTLPLPDEKADADTRLSFELTLTKPVADGLITFSPGNVVNWHWTMPTYDKFVVKFVDQETGERIKIVPQLPDLTCINDGVGGLICGFAFSNEMLKMFTDDHQYTLTAIVKASLTETDRIKIKSESRTVTAELIKPVILVKPEHDSVTNSATVTWITNNPTNVVRIKIKNIATGVKAVNEIATPVCVQQLPTVFLCAQHVSGLTFGNTYKAVLIHINDYGKAKSAKHIFKFDIGEVSG